LANRVGARQIQTTVDTDHNLVDFALGKINAQVQLSQVWRGTRFAHTIALIVKQTRANLNAALAGRGHFHVAVWQKLDTLIAALNRTLRKFHAVGVGHVTALTNAAGDCCARWRVIRTLQTLFQIFAAKKRAHAVARHNVIHAANAAVRLDRHLGCVSEENAFDVGQHALIVAHFFFANLIFIFCNKKIKKRPRFCTVHKVKEYKK